MSVPTTVFIVSNDHHQVHVGYTKDLELTMALIADGSYDASLAERGIVRLVYREELPTVREAIARVAEIEAMSPATKRRLVRERNRRWAPISPVSGVEPITHGTGSEPGCCVFVLGGEGEDDILRADLSTDLAATLILARAQARRSDSLVIGPSRIVFREYFPTVAEGRKRLREFKKMGETRLRALVKAANPGWNDLSPAYLLAPATVSGVGSSIGNPADDDGPDSAGGVTANLRGGPRTPVGVRVGRFEEPLPREERP